MARHLLGALLDPGQEHVREGLDAFLVAGSATTAAARVGLHPQSLRYRLRRVRELTDRDPRRSWDRFVLDLGSRIAASPLVADRVAGAGTADTPEWGRSASPDRAT